MIGDFDGGGTCEFSIFAISDMKSGGWNVTEIPSAKQKHFNRKQERQYPIDLAQ